MVGSDWSNALGTHAVCREWWPVWLSHSFQVTLRNDRVQSEEPGQPGGQIKARSVKAGGRIAFGEKTCCS